MNAVKVSDFNTRQTGTNGAVTSAAEKKEAYPKMVFFFVSLGAIFAIACQAWNIL